MAAKYLLIITIAFSVSVLGKLAYAATLFDCEYQFYSSDLLKIEREDMVLKFIVEDNGDAFMIGNNGATKVTPIISDYGISFVEVTTAGSVQVTAVDWNGISAHSRSSLMTGGLVPSQYYGKCITK